MVTIFTKVTMPKFHYQGTIIGQMRLHQNRYRKSRPELSEYQDEKNMGTVRVQ